MYFSSERVTYGSTSAPTVRIPSAQPVDHRSFHFPLAEPLRMHKQIFQAPIAIALCLITTSLNVLASDNPATHPTARQVTLGKETAPTVSLWLSTSLTRIFPNTKPG